MTVRRTSSSSPRTLSRLGNVREILYALFAVTLLVLFVACATAACLVSIRLEQRQAELAVRRTLGATHGRIAVDVAVELSLLAALATAAGVLLARFFVAIARPLAAGSLPRAEDIAIDGATLTFAAVAAVASILLAGVSPLVRALRGGPLQSLRGEMSREVRGSRRIAALPAIGIGLSAVAVVTALALVMSLIELGRVEPGFRAENIAAFVDAPPGFMRTLEQAVERARPLRPISRSFPNTRRRWRRSLTRMRSTTFVYAMTH
ncbi:MAG TPA: FtsX-like permease family protein [Gammaproteobacteria bacterium]